MTAILRIFGLPGTIALAAALVLLVLAVGQGLDRARLNARLETASAQNAILTNQRDTAVARVISNAASAQSWSVVADERNVLLQQCQDENGRVRAASEAGVRAAEAARADAERTLAQFTARYAADIREPGCARARANLDASCPLREY